MRFSVVRQQQRCTAKLTAAWLAASLAFAASALAQPAHDCGDHEAEDEPSLRAEAARPVAWRHAKADSAADTAAIKLLALNDFHGQLSAGRLVGGRPVGSAPVLAAYLRAAQIDREDETLILHAGDHVGATPPASALLQDEPSISFLNQLGNSDCSPRRRLSPRCNLAGAAGNHEFDEGRKELLRLLRGGNHPNGPFLQKPWRGASYPTLAANVIVEKSGKPLLPPFVIKRVGGVKVAIVGAVLEGTPTIVTPTGVAGLRFLDEAESINALVPSIRERGVEAIVVVIHQGGRQTGYAGPTDPAAAPLSGTDILDVVARLDDAIDVVVSGHAHSFTNALVPNANGKRMLVTQAFSSGTAYGDIDLTIDKASRDVIAMSASVVTTFADAGPGLTPDPEAAELTAAAETLVAPLVNQVVADAALDITRAENAAGESALGNLIADAQRSAMGTDFAFMNPGGIRDELLAGQVTWGELFSIQPFGNSLVRLDLSGAQVAQLLEQQWAGQPFPRILKTSGLSYVWDAAAPIGARVVEIRDAAGTLLDPAATYSVTVNSFLAAGGDNFTVLTAGTNPVGGPIDLDALIAYVKSQPQPFAASIVGRITRLN